MKRGLRGGMIGYVKKDVLNVDFNSKICYEGIRNSDTDTYGLLYNKTFTYLRYMIMKLLETIKDILATIWLITIFVILWAKITINHYSSQDTQQILQAISWSQLSMEYLVTEALEFNCKK